MDRDLGLSGWTGQFTGLIGPTSYVSIFAISTIRFMCTSLDQLQSHSCIFASFLPAIYLVIGKPRTFFLSLNYFFSLIASFACNLSTDYAFRFVAIIVALSLFIA
jgi:hypothetical protein